MAIAVALATNANNTVTVQVTSSGSTVTVYRAIGGTAPVAITGALTLSSGAATYLDTPPQKTLLRYYAVNNLGEISDNDTTVLPLNYSLAKPCLNGDIVLGDLVFNTIDSDGTVWTISDIEGWWSLATANIPRADRAPYEDGDYDDDGRYEARVFKFEGAFLPASSDLLETARLRLVRALDAVRRTTQLKVYETVPKYMDVRLTGTTQIETTKTSGLTYFSATLRASYPIKQSLSATSAALTPVSNSVGRTYSLTYPRTYASTTGVSSAIITNVGNYPSFPSIVIYGPLTNPRIENSRTGEYVEFLITLGDGDFLRIDMRNKSVMLNDQASRRGTATLGSTWWQVLSGNNEIRFSSFLSGSSAQASISAPSAWVG